jgi:hypothetical protein
VTKGEAAVECPGDRGRREERDHASCVEIDAARCNDQPQDAGINDEPDDTDQRKTQELGELLGACAL